MEVDIGAKMKFISRQINTDDKERLIDRVNIFVVLCLFSPFSHQLSVVGSFINK